MKPVFMRFGHQHWMSKATAEDLFENSCKSLAGQDQPSLGKIPKWQV